MKTQNKKRKGFTLVELLVVIAILAILASVSVVGYLSFTKKAKVSNGETELTQIREVLRGELLDGTTICVKQDTTQYKLSYSNNKVVVEECNDTTNHTHGTKTLVEFLPDLSGIADSITLSANTITVEDKDYTGTWNLTNDTFEVTSK